MHKPVPIKHLGKWLQIFNISNPFLWSIEGWKVFMHNLPPLITETINSHSGSVVDFSMWTRVRWKAICPLRNKGHHIIRDHIECLKMNKTFRSKILTLWVTAWDSHVKVKESGMHYLLQEKLCYFNYISAVLLFRGIDHGLIISFWLLDLCGGSVCCQAVIIRGSDSFYKSMPFTEEFWRICQHREKKKNLDWTAPTEDKEGKHVFLISTCVFYFILH